MPPIKKWFLKGKSNIAEPNVLTEIKRHLSERGSHHKTRKLGKGMNSGKLNVRIKKESLLLRLKITLLTDVRKNHE